MPKQYIIGIAPGHAASWVSVNSVAQFQLCLFTMNLPPAYAERLARGVNDSTTFTNSRQYHVMWPVLNIPLQASLRDVARF